MGEFGVTNKGFVLKRMDRILNEIHTELSEGFGIDTRINKPSFLDVLVTSFAGQIADLWETAQDSYYAKYPSTASGINLDNAVQYGGIRRESAAKTIYPLHCTGIDGTVVREKSAVVTNTNPQIRLFAVNDFTITREKFNSCKIKIAAIESADYKISINGNEYMVQSKTADEKSILAAIYSALKPSLFNIVMEDDCIKLEDTQKGRTNTLVLSSNLTTKEVTVIANFETEQYGKIYLPNGIVTNIVNNISGFDKVSNMLSAVYGRNLETDIELRQSYLAKSALRSNTMIDSIIAELLDNVKGIETVSGFENDTDMYNDRKMPPHSIEIIVDGGDDFEIAKSILRRKASGIQTFGNVSINVPGIYGDFIPVRFNRPEYLYVWLKVTLHCKRSSLPANYKQIVSSILTSYNKKLTTGKSLLIQLLNEGLYKEIQGITYVDILTSYRTNSQYKPADKEFSNGNVNANLRQKIILDESRIEVDINESP